VEGTRTKETSSSAPVRPSDGADTLSVAMVESKSRPITYSIKDVPSDHSPSTTDSPTCTKKGVKQLIEERRHQRRASIGKHNDLRKSTGSEDSYIEMERESLRKMMEENLGMAKNAQAVVSGDFERRVRSAVLGDAENRREGETCYNASFTKHASQNSVHKEEESDDDDVSGCWSVGGVSDVKSTMKQQEEELAAAVTATTVQREKPSPWQLLRNNLKESAESCAKELKEEEKPEIKNGADQRQGCGSQEGSSKITKKDDRTEEIIADYINLKMEVANLQAKLEVANAKVDECNDKIRDLTTQNAVLGLENLSLCDKVGHLKSTIENLLLRQNQWFGWVRHGHLPHEKLGGDGEDKSVSSAPMLSLPVKDVLPKRLSKLLPFTSGP
jgi:hypothetical protein